MAARALRHHGVRFTLLTCAIAGLLLTVATAPFAASRVDLSKAAKAPVCAKGKKSTAKKPCRVVKAKATAVKYVALPVCNAGQKSTTAKPCITLSNNGPSTSSKSSSVSKTATGSTSTSTKTSTTANTNTTTPPALFGPHINSHLCQAANGAVFECQPLPDFDPANIPPGNYPAI